MKDQRNVEHHGGEESPVEGRPGAQVVYQDEFVRYDIVLPTLTLNMIQEDPAPRFLIDGGSRSVTEACRRYVKLAQDILETVEAAI